MRDASIRELLQSRWISALSAAYRNRFSSLLEAFGGHHECMDPSLMGAAPPAMIHSI
jgi:hypothetical protein